MKKLILLIFTILLFIQAQAQLRQVFVETYYVSDSLDAMDTTNLSTNPSYTIPSLPIGSKTYRVYVQIDPGYRIKKIYGTVCNPMKIVSTADFFNNINRPTKYFGYLLLKSNFTGNPTLALDSWLTLGLCTTQHNGLLKSDDPDGSVINNPSVWASAYSAASAMLTNNNPSAGAAIDSADGMVPKTGTFSTWLDNGFRDAVSGGIDTTVFGSVTVGSQFISTNAFLQQNNGVKGDSATGSKILIGQFTTTGTLSFQFNLELLDSLGNSHNFIPESVCGTATGDTAISGLLKYPRACGCTDPHFLEYSANYSCSNSDSCHTRIVLGCMDTLACNYDPAANYHIQYLCCYPGLCADRDLSLVCPSISGDGGLLLFPNPVTDHLTIQFSVSEATETRYIIYDSYGIAVIEKGLGTRSGRLSEEIIVSDLQTGLYMVRIFNGNNIESKTFMKQ